MAIVINITDLEIEEWTVNIIRENVTVNYLLKDSEGIIWVRNSAIFWRNIPEVTDELGNPVPPPDNWYELPTTYVSHLNDITTHAETILLNLLT